MSSSLESLTSLWRDLIARAKKHKEDKFARTARRARAFVGKSYEDLYVNVKDDRYKPFAPGLGPRFYARLNLSQQFVNLYLPHLHFRNPQRVVEPDRPQMPPELLGLLMDQEIPPGTPMPKTELQKTDAIRAWLMSWFLNYMPREYNLRREGELAIKDGLMTGRGVVWHEVIDGAHGEVPASFYESVDGLLIDPDCQQMRNAGWIIRQGRLNRFDLAEKVGLKPERLKRADLTSLPGSDNIDTDTEDDGWRQKLGDEHETVVYYEVYCRKGLGFRYGGGPAEVRSELDSLRERFGDMEDQPCYLVFCPGVSFPLNLPPEAFTEETTLEEIRARLEWPIPFHRDAVDPWPCSVLDFDPHTKDPWAKSPLEAGMPLQVFLDQCYGFLMDRIAASSRNITFVSDAIEKKVKQAIIEGVDQLVVGVSESTGQAIKDLIYEHTFEPVTQDLYTIIGMVQRKYEEITGQNPLLGGDVGDTQPRSSGEMQIRDSRASSRPDDFAERVESWHGMIARKEGIAARLLVAPETVAPLFGEPVERDEETGEIIRLGMYSQTWAELVNTNDPTLAAAELSYTIEAGSGRREDKAKQAQDVQMVGQIIAPTLGQVYMATGIAQPLNAFVAMLGKTYNVRLDDVSFPDLQQMMAEQAGQGQEGQQDTEAAVAAEQAAAMTEQIKVQMELAKAETEKIKVELEEVKLDIERTKIDLEREKLKTMQAKAKAEKAKPAPAKGTAA